MDLFEVVNGKVVPSVFALRTYPFNHIWAEDESEDKAYAMKVFDYVEFLCSPKRSNPYFGPRSDEDRIKRVKRVVWGSENAEISMEVTNAVAEYIAYLESSSPAYALVVDGMEAVVNLRTFLRSVDYTAITSSGAMKIKPSDVLGALNKIPETMKKLETARDELLTGLMESAGKTRAEREIGAFED